MKLFSLLPRRLSHFACNSPPARAPPIFRFPAGSRGDCAAARD